MKDTHNLSYYLFCSFSMSFSPLLRFYHYKKMVSSRYFPVFFFFLTLVFNFQMQQNFEPYWGELFFLYIEET